MLVFMLSPKGLIWLPSQTLTTWTTGLLTTAKAWKQTESSLMDEWIKKIRYLYLYMYLCICIHISTHICICIYPYTYAYTYNLHTCMYADWAIIQPHERETICLQQHGWTWRMPYSVKQARHRKTNTVWSHMYVESKKLELPEAEYIVVTRD